MKTKLIKLVKTYLRKIVLKGNIRVCNICGFQSLVYLPYLGKRLDAQCVSCGSLERNRLLFSYISNETNLLTQKFKLLHVAPDLNTYKILAQNKNLEYIYIDKIEKGYENAYPKKTLNLDITDLSVFKNDEFDYIICSHVLEHVIEDRKASGEFYRILKPNGKAILMIPWDKSMSKTFEDPSIIDPIERRKHFGQSDHVRIYGFDFTNRITDSGFQLEVNNYINNFNSKDVIKFGFKDDEIFIATKPKLKS